VRWGISRSRTRRGLVPLLCMMLLALTGCGDRGSGTAGGRLDLLPLAVPQGDEPGAIRLAVTGGSPLLGAGWRMTAGAGEAGRPAALTLDRQATLRLPICPEEGTAVVTLRLRDPGADGERAMLIASFNGRKLVRLTPAAAWADHRLELPAHWFHPGVNELVLTGPPGRAALGHLDLRLPGPAARVTSGDATRRALVSSGPLVVDLPDPLPAGARLHLSVADLPARLYPLRGPVHHRLEGWRDGHWVLLAETELGWGGGREPEEGWVDLQVSLDRLAGVPGARLRLRAEAPLQAWGPLLLSWPGAGGTSPASESGAPNLILILADTLRADRLGAHGTGRRLTPHLDRLAAGSVQFGDTLAQAPSTIPSVSSFFTGRYFNRVSAWVDRQDLPAAIPLFAEALSGAGCQTLAVVANPLMMPETGFARGFDEYHHLPGIIQSFHGREELPVHRSAAAVNERFFGRLSAFAGERFFAYLHFMDPHDPYPVEGGLRFSGGRLEGRPWEGWLGPATGEIREFGDSSIRAGDREMVKDSYDEGVRRFDRQMGVLLAELRRRGLLDNTVVAVIADHGEELFERDLVGHGHTVHEELLRVPALIRFPGRPGDPEPMLVRRRVELLDVAATLLDLMGAGPPAGHAGASQLPLLSGAEPGAGGGERFFETRHRGWVDPPLNGFLAGVEQNGWKLVRDRQGGGDRLFNLVSDPGETEDLARREPDLARGLGRRLEQWLIVQAPLDPEEERDAAPGREVEARQVEALQALGYMQ